MEIVREMKPKGIIVIPKDIREMIRLREKDKITFTVRDDEIIIKKQQNPKIWLNDFFNAPKKRRKSLTLKELKKIEDESYDLP
ncbi:MAG: AbrB/MazE/SpoVT family DNA-binding domain-containing protein [Nanoarchaeota archaeon]